MALVNVRGTSPVLDRPEDIENFLGAHGAVYRFWGGERIPDELRRPSLDDRQKAAMLALYAKEIADESRSRGYQYADVVWVGPDDPAGLERFREGASREHTHDFDELRLVVNGHATYTVRGNREEVIDAVVGPGDFIGVPGGRRHWVTLLADRRLMVVRLLKDIAHKETPFWIYYSGTGTGPTEIPRETIARAFGEEVAGAELRGETPIGSGRSESATSDLTRALTDWRTLLGGEYVLTDESTLRKVETTTFATTQRVPAVLCPGNRDEVQECLRIANRHRIPVYPSSGGKNWSP